MIMHAPYEFLDNEKHSAIYVHDGEKRVSEFELLFMISAGLIRTPAVPLRLDVCNQRIKYISRDYN